MAMCDIASPECPVVAGNLNGLTKQFPTKKNPRQFPENFWANSRMVVNNESIVRLVPRSHLTAPAPTT